MVDGTGSMTGGGGGLHQMAPRSIVADRPGSGGARKHGQKGKDELFSFDKQNLDMFSLPAGAAAGGGGRGIRGLAGSRKARPPKPLHSASTDPAAPKGTEGATTTVAGSLSKIFTPQPAQAAIAESLSVNNATGMLLASDMQVCCGRVSSPCVRFRVSSYFSPRPTSDRNQHT